MMEFRKKAPAYTSADPIAYMDEHFNSILFTGFHFLQKHQYGGWVYWLPRYLYEHTALKIYFLSNDHELLFLDRNGSPLPIDSSSLPSVDIFFGRTLSSFRVSDKLVQTAKLRLIYPMGKKPSKKIRSLPQTFIIDDRDFVKPIPKFERNFFHGGSGRKDRENTVIFPASLHRRKGQLKFIQSISPKTMKGMKLLFCGTMNDPDYADRCFETLKKKKIDFSYLGKLEKQQLGEHLRSARLSVLYSTHDWNPRAYYESLVCGTPCLLSRQIRVAKDASSFASRASSFDLNRSFLRALEYPEDYPRLLSRKASALTDEERCYRKLFSMIS